MRRKHLSEVCQMEYKRNVKVNVIDEGFDGKTCWVHGRAGAIPQASGKNKIVLTAQKLDLSGSDVFGVLHSRYSEDDGRTWTPFEPQNNLSLQWYRPYTVLSDFTPRYHAATKKLLGTGHTVEYSSDAKVLRPRHCDTVYSVYDCERDCWGPSKVLYIPSNLPFFNSGAGSTQRFDLEDGTILLPIRYLHDARKGVSRGLILRLSFDGEKLSVIEFGDPICVDSSARGVSEPSIIRAKDCFLAALRTDEQGYLCKSKDGLHFGAPVPLRFDTGELVQNYNTQQHFLAHENDIYLVYTRKNGQNDHVFRHRAPLFMARIDPDSMTLCKESEQAITPERGARLGNFGVTQLNENAAVVTVCEWMQPIGCEKYGSDNAIFFVEIT